MGLVQTGQVPPQTTAEGYDRGFFEDGQAGHGVAAIVTVPVKTVRSDVSNEGFGASGAKIRTVFHFNFLFLLFARGGPIHLPDAR